MEKKYLPIGSVVLLKNATKKLMIVGYFPIPNNEENKIYDYSACLYPEGIFDSSKISVLNHEDIERIIFFGKENDEYFKLRDGLKIITNVSKHM